MAHITKSAIGTRNMGAIDTPRASINTSAESPATHSEELRNNAAANLKELTDLVVRLGALASRLYTSVSPPSDNPKPIPITDSFHSRMTEFQNETYFQLSTLRTIVTSLEAFI